MEQELNSTLLKRKKIINIFILLAFIFVFLFALSAFLIFKFKMNIPFAYIFVIGTVVDVYFIFYYKNKTIKIIKQGIFTTLIPQIFDKATYIQEGISREKFNESGLYLNYNKYYTSDRIKKGIDELDIANVTAIYKKNDDTQSTSFKGIFAIMKLNDFYEDEIIIKPDYENKFVSTLFDSKNKLLGENKNIVRLENTEFERYFEVYSRNQIKARQLVTVEYMENLLYLKNKLNTIIKIIYLGNKKYIAIWNKRLVDEKDFYKNGVHLEKIKENISKILEVIQKV